MKILAIDPGVERVGIAIVKKNIGSETLLYSDCFKTPAGKPAPLRLRLIGEEVRKIIKTHKPDVLATEALFFNTNKKTALGVAEARGVILYEASRARIPVHEYTPPEIKMAITGYGHATKEQVARMVSQLIHMGNEKKRIDDETDAVAIGLTHSACVRTIISRPPQEKMS